jgi:hypothetical protein
MESTTQNSNVFIPKVPSATELAETSEIDDYNDFLKSLGISDSDVIKMMESNVCFDSEQHKESLEILDSEIHGKGLFAMEDIEVGREWLAALGNYKYSCGRIINHSPDPNCKFIFDDNQVTCITIKKVEKGCELFVNYRSHVNLHSVSIYKQSAEVAKFDSKVPSIKDWESSSPIDKIEYELSTLPVAEIPLTHIFTDGLYIRKAHAPAGSMFTTVHHNTEHPFILVSGTTEVISNEEAHSITGPFMGITKKGTRRLVYAVTDATYLTIHANPDNLTDPDEIIRRITIPVDNPLMDIEDPRFNTWKKNISPSEMILTNNTNK